MKKSFIVLAIVANFITYINIYIYIYIVEHTKKMFISIPAYLYAYILERILIFI